MKQGWLFPFEKAEESYRAYWFGMSLGEGGIDTPHEESPVVWAYTLEDLERKIYDVFEGIGEVDRGVAGMNWERHRPDVVLVEGKIDLDLCRRFVNYNFDISAKLYSNGEETVEDMLRRYGEYMEDTGFKILRMS